MKVCCIGDTLMATPTIAALASRFPGVQIDVALGAWSRIALHGNTRIARLIDTADLFGGRRPEPRTLLGVARRLRAGGYDAAIVLERSLWIGLVPLLAGVPRRIGLASGWRSLPHTRRIAATHPRHEAEVYLDCARSLGAEAPRRRMEFTPGVEAEHEARRALDAAGVGREPYAVLHPAGGSNPGMVMASKRWPSERFAEIAGRLERRGVRPVVVWGRGEEAPGRVVEARGAVGIGSRLSFPGLGALAAGATVYVGNDAGTTHLALAVGAPTVVVFGPSDERRFGPYGSTDDGVPLGEAVASPVLAPDDPSPAFLTRPVESVSVDDVWSAVERALARDRR